MNNSKSNSNEKTSDQEKNPVTKPEKREHKNNKMLMRTLSGDCFLPTGHGEISNDYTPKLGTKDGNNF